MDRQEFKNNPHKNYIKNKSYSSSDNVVFAKEVANRSVEHKRNSRNNPHKYSQLSPTKKQR